MYTSEPITLRFTAVTVTSPCRMFPSVSDTVSPDFTPSAFAADFETMTASSSSVSSRRPCSTSCRSTMPARSSPPPSGITISWIVALPSSVAISPLSNRTRIVSVTSASPVNRSAIASALSSLAATSRSYRYRSSYCLGPSVSTESLIANPQTMSAVHPATPPTVMIRRLLNRKMLRTVTLLRKLSRLHTGLMRSSSTREPAFGAFGRMSWAGVCRSSPRHAAPVAVSTATTNSAMPRLPYSQSYSRTIPGMTYMFSSTVSRKAGMPRNPTSRPMPPPIRQASAANSRYREAMVRLP